MGSENPDHITRSVHVFVSRLILWLLLRNSSLSPPTQRFPVPKLFNNKHPNYPRWTLEIILGKVATSQITKSPNHQTSNLDNHFLDPRKKRPKKNDCHWIYMFGGVTKTSLFARRKDTPPRWPSGYFHVESLVLIGVPGVQLTRRFGKNAPTCPLTPQGETVKAQFFHTTSCFLNKIVLGEGYLQ